VNRIEQIKVEQKKLADELEGEMIKERANVLAKIKDDIKLFGFKTNDFKGILLNRAKRGTDLPGVFSASSYLRAAPGLADIACC
jgi:hypothetical protein